MEEDYHGRRVTIIGLGLFGGGVGAARFFAERGARVTVTDLKGPEQLAESIGRLRGYDIHYRLRRHRFSDVAHADIVVPSPAVPRDSPFVKAAREHGAQLDTEMNLFIRLCPARILGITGTNGKTTTAAMLDHILRAAGRESWLGGNIGRSLLADLPSIRPGDLVVLEMSSFQLEWLPQVARSPHVSVVTNLAPDHLDRHGTMERYMAAKWPILAYQKAGDWAVINAHCPALSPWRERAQARVVPFSAAHALDEGVFCRGGAIVARLDGHSQQIAPVEAVGLPGRHNLENALAAVAACVIVGLAPREIEAGLRSFEGVEHRLEFVAEIGGVRYYNDSKATTPSSTVVALRSFDVPVVLIAGGSGKGLCFDPMAREAARRARGVLLIGATGEEIGRCVREQSSGQLDPVICRTLREAVLAARELAQPRDVVLLSPGDASYDMFRNYEERGRAFKEQVRRLASGQLSEQGQRR